MRRNDLIDLIQKAFGLKGLPMGRKEAQESADLVLSFFGYGSWCTGNHLNQDERMVFYMLEDLGILKSMVEDVGLNTKKGEGNNWRVCQWTYDPAGIQRILSSEPGRPDGVQEFYESLPDHAYSSSQVMIFEKESGNSMQIPEYEEKEEEMQEIVVAARKNGKELKATDETLAYLASQGKDIKSIARETGMRYDAVWQRLKKLGVRPDKKGPDRRTNTRYRVDMDRLRILSAKGATGTEIARELNIPEKLVWYYKKKLKAEPKVPEPVKPAPEEPKASVEIVHSERPPAREKPLEFYLSLSERLIRWQEETAEKSILAFVKIEKKREDYQDEDILKALEVAFRSRRIVVR